MQIYLVGFMGAGKSTVGKKLAPLLNRKFIDTDDAIVNKIGMSISEFFEQYGEDAFRKLEHEVLEEVSAGEDAIIACGGGVAIFQNNVDCMRTYGKIFLLQASPETVLSRVKNDEKRPLLKNRKTIEGIAELMEKRVPYYEKAADFRVVCDGKTSKIVACEIAEIVKEEQGVRD